jgi:chromosome segregation ATPase
MSDTKAIERALNLVLENTVLCASYGGVFREAAAELEQLRGDMANLTISNKAYREENAELKNKYARDIGLDWGYSQIAQISAKLEGVEADRRGWKSMYERDETTIAQLRTALDEARLSIQGGALICKAFLKIKANSDERDEPVPHVEEWLRNATAWLEAYPK